MVLTGGRGLGHFSNGFKGGVHLCSKPGDVTTFASKMLGSNLITKQTTAEGIRYSLLFFYIQSLSLIYQAYRARK
jgi:succinyl-CoA synthetase beta subunit